MATVELVMPEMGESVTDATISNWLIKEGDSIEVDQDILEVSTDKVDTEIPSPTSGVVKQILHREGEVVEVGKALAIIEVEGEAEIKPSPAVDEQRKGEANYNEENNGHQKPVTEDELKHPTPPFIPEQQTASPVQSVSATSGDRFYSPLVRNIAEQEGISQEELDRITGSGVDNRVTKQDILDHLQHREYDASRTASSSTQPVVLSSIQKASIAQSHPLTDRSSQNISPVKVKDGDEIIEMDKMRKLIANHMVMSKQVSPHVSLFLEADVTNLWNWRQQAKAGFADRENQKLTFTPLFIEATTKAIKAFPEVNVSIVDGDKIHYKKEINIGMATALPSGNLIVPVVKNTADKTLSAIAKDVNDLAERARNSALKPDDTAGGTFTLTNIGTFDSLMGTPIINQPQAAILAVGAIKKKPVVLETEAGDVIAIRHMMYLSLSMDHRIVDGALGGAFLQRVKNELEDWDVNREV